MFAVFQLLQMVLGFVMWTLIGQGALALLIWPRRHANAIYRVLSWITWPVRRPIRMLMPKFVNDVHIGWVALLLLGILRLGIYMAFYSQGWIPTIQPPAQ